MAARKRKDTFEDVQWTVKPSRNYFFVNKKLVRVIVKNRGQNIVIFYNVTDCKNQTMLLSDFKKHGKRAYSVQDTGKLLNKTGRHLRWYVKHGIIDPPTGALPDGERRYQVRAYYSEDDVFSIREAISKVHQGRPRKDGRVTNNSVLTEQELRARMGDALVLYTRTKNGDFIPVWAEEAY